MQLRYSDPPREGQHFNLMAVEVAGRARFRVFLNGEEIATAECDDPPCYEAFDVPRQSAGKILLIEVFDDRERQELVFFINDDGRGVPMEKPDVVTVAPTAIR